MLLAGLFGVALAGVGFERPPSKVEQGPLEPAPLSTSTAAYKAWRERMSTRGGYAVLDTALAWRADDIDACVRKAGGNADATAVVDVKLSAGAGTAAIKPKSGDATLGGCVASVVGGLVSAPLRRDVTSTVTVTFTAGAAVAADGSADDGSAGASGDGAAAGTDAAAGAGTAPAGAVALAFSPALDDEGGFGAIAFGAPASAHESLTEMGVQQGTSFYQRQADYLVKWFGAPLFGASYAFGEDGFYAVTVGVVGTTTTWRLREALTARYGPPRWDNRFGSYYWRGERLLLQFRPVPGAEDVTITLLDIARARASGLADELPGDPADPSEPDADRRLPRIFQK